MENRDCVIKMAKLTHERDGDNYIFVCRATPATDGSYTNPPEMVAPEMFTNKDHEWGASLVGLPICFAHDLDLVLGRVIGQRVAKDGSIIAACEIDARQKGADIVISQIENKYITGVSVSFKPTWYSTKYEIIEGPKRFIELSVTSAPDRTDDSCSILFGSRKSEMKIKQGDNKSTRTTSLSLLSKKVL